MDLKTKKARVFQEIRGVSTHDDAPLKEVEAVLEDVEDFIKDELEDAVKRRAAKEKGAAPKKGARGKKKAE